LPPGSNLQAQLEELARRSGVSLTVLTQQAVAEMSNAFWQATTGPIDFYGKVVDSQGAPLGGTTARISCLIFPESQFKTNIVTDSHGLFAVQGITGTALRVSLAKQDFEEPPGTNEHQFIYYSTGLGFRSDSKNPATFILRKKAAEQK
jgi:hypothetical protein